MFYVPNKSEPEQGCIKLLGGVSKKLTRRILHKLSTNDKISYKLKNSTQISTYNLYQKKSDPEVNSAITLPKINTHRQPTQIFIFLTDGSLPSPYCAQSLPICLHYQG
jgi:hypothetical protein